MDQHCLCVHVDERVQGGHPKNVNEKQKGKETPPARVASQKGPAECAVWFAVLGVVWRILHAV